MAHFIYPQATSTTAFLLDGSTVSPTLDTSNALVNKPMPVVALAGSGLGPLSVNTGAADATTLRVVLTSDSTISIEEDKNYGVVGANTIRTASQIGNATGAAAFGSGADSAQTLRVTLSTRAETAATPLSVRLSDGSAFLTNLPVSQSGTWNITNITGSISLPTGAATDAKQDTMITSLQLLDDAVATGGAAALPKALQVAGTDGVNAQIISTTASGHVNIADGGNTITVDGTVSANQSGTWNITNITGSVSLPTGAATETTLSGLNGKIANDYGVATGAIRAAAQVGNASGVADFGTGAASAQTLRVALASDTRVPTGFTPVQVISRDYSSSSISGTYSNLGSTLSAAGNCVAFFETGGSPIIIGWGSADKFVIPPGGAESPLLVNIPSGTQLQIKTADGTTVSSGRFLMTVLG